VAQYDKQSILIFGGFNGRFLKDAYIFNPFQRQIRLADHQPENELFSF